MSGSAIADIYCMSIFGNVDNFVAEELGITRIPEKEAIQCLFCPIFFQDISTNPRPSQRKENDINSHPILST